MQVSPMTLGITIIILTAVMFILYLITGSGSMLFLMIAVIAILAYALYTMGYLTLKVTSKELELDYHERTKPSSGGKHSLTPIFNKEVFYVGPNNYQYTEARAVCAAYGADLATYDQLMEAYSSGAEWCGYGWTAGGMALYPTQQGTWDSLQQEIDQNVRTSCGRPGINGGYFDPKTKFGVNCYGTKPGDKKNTKYPLPLPGTDTGTFEHLVDKFKHMLNQIPVFSFNRQEWSEYPSKVQPSGSVKQGSELKINE
jgi:hypothetical protein